MIERFNGRIREVLAGTRFCSGEPLEDTLIRYVKVYNQHIPQKALGHVSPIQSMKEWHKKRPALFKKNVYNLTGLDTHTVLEWMDGKYRLLCQKLPSRKRLFNDLRTLTRYLCFASWEALMDFMLASFDSPTPKPKTG